jgi:uncharacterized phage protein gp47/JayE
MGGDEEAKRARRIAGRYAADADGTLGDFDEQAIEVDGGATRIWQGHATLPNGTVREIDVARRPDGWYAYSPIKVADD